MQDEPLVVVVDDEPDVVRVVAEQVQLLGYEGATANSATQALEVARNCERPLVVLSDVDMPEKTGVDLLRSIRSIDETAQVVMITGLDDTDTLRECLREGAYDYLIKPFPIEELRHTLGRSADRATLLRQNLAYRHRLERMVEFRTKELQEMRDIALLTLARLAESRDPQTGRHVERISAYAFELADTAGRLGLYPIDALFRKKIEQASLLHDIGKVGIPDAILLKPGPLTDEETAIMRTHTSLGGDTLKTIIPRYQDHDFLRMAMAIAYSHHEKWDGTGYPVGLSDVQIPLAARIVAICDAYDAIRSPRPYKRQLGHSEALERIHGDSGSHFDPKLVQAFENCHDRFRAIHLELGDPHDYLDPS